MARQLAWLCVLASTLCSTMANGAEFATPAEARAMLDRAIVAVRTDAPGAIEKFNHNDRPFRDRDLFVFCFDARDGRFTAHEAMLTHDVRQLRDTTGRPFGDEMYRSAREGQVAEVRYLWPIPGSTRVAAKDAYVTRVGDQVCGVSVYRQDVRPHVD